MRFVLKTDDVSQVWQIGENDQKNKVTFKKKRKL